MTWSEYDDHPIKEEMLEKRAENAIERHIEELEFRYKDNYDNIENFISDQYPSPEDAPDLPPSSLAELAGRELEENVGKIREFYTEFNGTDNMREQDYQRTLEYLGFKALKNGSN